MSTSTGYVVIADRIDETQRALLHEEIKLIAPDEWWHELADTWVVLTDLDIRSLRDRLVPLTRHNNARLILFALKQTRGGRWAGTGGWSTQWFQEHMSSKLQNE